MSNATEPETDNTTTSEDSASATKQAETVTEPTTQASTEAPASSEQEASTVESTEAATKEVEVTEVAEAPEATKKSEGSEDSKATEGAGKSGSTGKSDAKSGEKMVALCDKLEKLITSDKQFKAANQAKKIQEQWKVFAESNPSDARNLAKRFKAAEDEFFKVHRQFLQNDEWMRWSNFKKREDLCALVDKLSEEENQENIVKAVRQTQSDWKKIGPVSHKDSEVIWQRFKKTCDDQYARCGDFLALQEKDREVNLKAKEALCEKASALASDDSWRKTGDILKKLQEEWNNVGPVPRGSDRKLYSQFRKACNTFFKARTAHYKIQDGMRDENLVFKLTLVEEAKVLSEEKDLKTTEVKFKDLQQRWKESGPVPRDKDQEVWDAFRTACDGFYVRLDESRRDNLGKREEVLAQAEALVDGADDKADIEQIKVQIKGLQRKFTSLPPGPRAEDKALGDKFFKFCNGYIRNAKTKTEKEAEELFRSNQAREKALEAVEATLFAAEGADLKEKYEESKTVYRAVSGGGDARSKELKKRFQKASQTIELVLNPAASQGTDETVRTKALEALCVRAELLGSGSGDGGSLSLAERMQIALQSNVPKKGRDGSKADTQKEAASLKQEWLAVAPISIDAYTALLGRAKKAFDAL